LYFINDGYKIAKNAKLYLSEAFIAGACLPDGRVILPGQYTFDAEGKMMIKNGVYDGYMYINNEQVDRYALIQLNGDYYFVGDGRKVAMNQTVYLTAEYVNGYTYADGTPLDVGYYTFDAEGKMLIKHGVVDGYMYINGTRINTYTLVKFNGDYYFVSDGRKVATNSTLYLSEKFVAGFTFDDGTPLVPGNYTFDADGRMIFN
jgi:hypothetical protein